MKNEMASLLLAGVVAGCAGAERTPQMMDPIVIPETAVSVDHMTLFQSEVWVPINGRMLLARAGTKHFLLVFNQPCAPLRKERPDIMVRGYSSNAVYANSDLVQVSNVMCPVNDIYEILEEDAIALRTRAKR